MLPGEPGETGLGDPRGFYKGFNGKSWETGLYIYNYIYIYIYDRGLIYRIEVQDICISLQWVNYNDLKRRPKPIDDGECKGNHPHMGELFRLVNYCNLPRWEMDGEILGK